MSLEQAIQENTAAIKELIAVMGKGGAAAASSGDTETKTTRGRSSGKKDEGETTKKYTAEQVKAAAVKVKDELGTPAAKKLIKAHGASELAELKPEQYGAFIAACNKALKGDDDDGDGDGEGEDTL